ncbi:MAG: PAS domain S-box protein [Betaproteobacteria bacterium]|nr:PAS domain S-box protein [Betaproteobacteria bacterium]
MTGSNSIPVSSRPANRMTVRALYVVLAGLLLALAAVALYTVRSVEAELTDAAIARRTSIAHLAAATLSGRFDRVIDLGVSLATRVQFRELVAAGNWTGASALLRSVPDDFRYVDRLFLTDVQGTLMADVPELQGARGQNFAFREWYAGVRKDWAPYVSSVYKRSAVPQRNVVAVAIPVRDPGGRAIAILVIQVELDAFFDWVGGVDLGPGGVVYAVDSRRRIAFHPVLPAQGETRDLSGSPFAGRLARGEAGVEIGPGPIDGEAAVSAFVPAKHGWGVVAQQPAAAVFATRDSQLRRVATGFTVILVLCTALAYLGMQLLKRHRQAEEDRRIKDELAQQVEGRTAQLETARRELADLYDNAPCGYHSVDAEGKFVRINDTWLSWLGYEREEVVGKLRHPDIMTPESAARFHAEWFPLFKRQGWLKEVEFEYVRKDGTTFPASLSATTIRDAAGKYLMSRSTVSDSTERKRIENEMKGLNAQLPAANRELESFSYSVSHDLRAPLRAIDGFALMLEEDCAETLDGEGKRLLAVVRAESKRMGQLIDDLLAFSRTGRQRLDPAPIDMTALAREAATEAARDYPSIAVQLGELPEAHGDRAMLRQVWANLVGNACKYSSRNSSPRVEIEGRANGADNEYWVRDNGVGFDPRYAGKLFGVFRRLHGAHEFPGTGVGLAIVQRVVARHGGRVWCEGRPNEGARFGFALPKRT